MGDGDRDLEQMGQSHLLAFAGELNPDQLDSLRKQISSIDFRQIKELHRQSFEKPIQIDPSRPNRSKHWLGREVILIGNFVLERLQWDWRLCWLAVWPSSSWQAGREAVLDLNIPRECFPSPQ